MESLKQSENEIAELKAYIDDRLTEKFEGIDLLVKRLNRNIKKENKTNLANLVSQFEVKLNGLEQQIVEKLEKPRSESSGDLMHLKKQLKTLSNMLDRGFNELEMNVTTNVQNYIDLTNYILTNKLPLTFQGWPIAADLGLKLISDLHSNHYDRVIEFGSGSSTVLFSKIIRNLYNDNLKVTSFEHSEEYLLKTEEMLNMANVEETVELLHAPLKNFVFDEQVFQFYSIDKTLLKMASELGESPAIMILVDGPPGSTNAKARFPALPLIHKYFPKATLHFYLDDFHRDEEVQIANDWQKYLSNSNATFSTEIIDLNKGLFIIKVSTANDVEQN